MKARIFAEENRKWWTLAAVSFGLFMIMLDNTVVNVALPSIQHDLGLSLSELEWVVAGYAPCCSSTLDFSPGFHRSRATSTRYTRPASPESEPQR